MRRHRLLSLDALRGVAAIGVLLHHAEREFHLSFGFAYGYLAVDAFFLMSGFVIAGAYEARMRAGLSLFGFLRLRAIRLYPMLMTGALLGAGVALLQRGEGLALLLATVSALTALPLIWSGPLLFPLNAPEWSIFFELITNAVHRIGIEHWQSRLIAVMLVVSVLLLGLAGLKLHGLANGFSPATFWGGFPRAFFSYFMGMLLHRTQARWRPMMPKLPLPLVLAAFISVVVGEQWTGGRVPASAYWVVTTMLIFPLGLMLLVATREPSRFGQLAAALGDLSYPLYAVHMPVLLLAAPGLVGLPSTQRIMTASLLMLMVSFGALLLDRWWDRPIRRWLQRSGSHCRRSGEVGSAAP